jgi:hypothetical protein
MSGLPRRVFDRSVVLAGCRWECLRRTADYRVDAFRIIREAAQSMGWSQEKFARYCLEHGGVLEPPAGAGRDPYDETCARYGLIVLMHPDVRFTDDEMAAFPLFADTPKWQPKVKDRAALLQRFAKGGMDLSLRTQRRLFAKERVPSGRLQLNLKRVRHGHFDQTLAVFDARVAGKSFRVIAKALGLSLPQAKRAWETARCLIPKWLDLESHVATCPTCLAYLRNKRDRWCAAVELQIGLRPTGLSRLRPSAERLDILAARQEGHLPARRSMKQTKRTGDA